MLFACSMIPFTAGASGLGEVRVTSKLGDRFRAEIPLLNFPSAIAQACFELTSKSADTIAEVPWLKDAQIALLSAPPRLVISTHRQVAEPVIQFAVHTACGVDLTRHYAAFLSPGEAADGMQPIAREPINVPAVSKAAPASTVSESSHLAQSAMRHTSQPGETTADMARRLYPRSELAQRRFIHKMIALNPEWLTSDSGDDMLPEGIELTYPKRPLPKVASTRPSPPPVAASKSVTKEVSRDRLMVKSSNEPTPLAPATPPTTTGEIGNRLNAVETQVGTLRRQLNALRAEYPTATPAIQTMLVEMETRLLTQEIYIARIKLAELQAAPEATNSGTVEKQIASPGNEQPEIAPIIAAASVQPPPASASPVTSTQVLATDRSGLGSLGFVLGAFGFGLGAFLYRRTSPGANKSAAMQELASSIAENIAPRRPVKLENMAPALAPNPLVDSWDEEIDPPTRAPMPEDPKEVEHPIELADIMMTYGRKHAAIEVLRSFIDIKPQASLLAGLRLLEIYQQTDMRHEFEQLAKQLATRFNVERASWDAILSPGAEIPGDPADLSEPPGAIGNIPQHIQTQIAANWGQKECLDFLHQLLTENRGGSRRGFSLSVTREILSLITLLEHKHRQCSATG